MNRLDRTGEIGKTHRGNVIKIVEYIDHNNIIVEFLDNHEGEEIAKVHTTYKSFKDGTVKSPYDITVHGVGYKGVGKYSCKTHKRAWDNWSRMLRRCYDPYTINKNITYKDCYVCKEWFNFQNFAKWHEENFYAIPGINIQLDKDILYKGNKIYSPETCIYVPQRINSLFLNKPSCRGKLPIGCFKSYNKICSRCCTPEGSVHLGRFDTVEEAFLAYKEFKENYTKQIADEYKKFIPEKLYIALYNYKVEIND
jgi:hypothetical protein